MSQVLLASLSWWLAAQVFGLAALPITRRVLRWLPDSGYAFSKVVGLLLVSYLLWLGASTGLIQNNLGGILLALLVVTGFSTALALAGGWDRAVADWRAFWHQNRVQIVVVEILFLLVLVGWAALRAYAPSKIVSAYGEKYMEIAFLNGILRSPHFPPLDPWMSQYAISYYYFGYVMMALVTRLTGAAPTVGFDLYDALLFALTASAAFGVVYNMVAASGVPPASGGPPEAGGTRRDALSFGLVGALLTAWMGNLEGLIHGLHSAGWLPARFEAWIDIPGLLSDPRSGSFYPGHDFYTWWWWRASRVINDVSLTGQPTGLEPITEFPFFSFLLGDNHPHKLALPFVLLAIGLAFNLLLMQLQGRSGSPPAADQDPTAGSWRSWLGAAWTQRDTLALTLFYALALGALAFLNTWDFPIYLGLVLLAFALGLGLSGDLSRTVLYHTLGLGVLLGAASIGLYILFYIGFSSQASGLLPYVFPPTRLPQYLVMFGPFAFILACFLAAAFWSAGRLTALLQAAKIWLALALSLYGAYVLVLAAAGVLLSRGLLIENGFANPDIKKWSAGLEPVQLFGKILSDRLQNPWTFLFLSILIALGLVALWLHLRPSGAAPSADLSPAALFAVLLAVLGLALTLSVEFVYLRDFFGARMNTVFKFYFQGWVLMACASAYGVWWLLRTGALPAAARVIFGVAAAGLVAAGLVYSVMGIYSRAHGFTYPPEIDAGATVAGRYPGHWNSFPDDWVAIQWLRQRLPDASGSQVPVILEASVGSYRHGGRFSAFTGFPAVLGWDYHEYQWRGTQNEQNRRLADIHTIYTTPNPDLAFDLLQHWQVDYVVLGSVEQDYIGRTCRQPEQPCNPRRAVEKFERFLTPVFSEGETTLFAVPDLGLP